MDSAADVEVIQPLEVRCEAKFASIGEKRPVENGKGSERATRSLKKARIGDGLAGNMKKVAELVLVLATMGTMSAGRRPTAAEIQMMVEAREKMVEVCQGFAPKDVFPRDAFGAVIKDLGLCKFRDQGLGFRPPNISIAEKLKLTKLKMEKSEENSLHSATFSSQRLQTNLGAAAESCGTSNGVRIFSSDNKSHAPNSSGGFQSSLGHVSAAKSTPLLYQLPSSEVVSSGLPSNHLGRDFSSLAMSRTERPHFRLDGKYNGASYTSQVQANSSRDHPMVKTPTWSVQLQPVSSAKIGSELKVTQHYSSAKIVSDIKVSSQASVMVEGAADTTISRVVPHATSSNQLMTQTTLGSQSSAFQHVEQGVKIVHAPALSNIHNEIGKIVQKLLLPQLPKHHMWIPPSRDYMNKALTCQTCKLIINEVDSVLVCDACEKGYHLKCQQFLSKKTIPRGEWHCGKCLSLSNDKPLPPKYGRVLRNASVSNVSSNATLIQSFSEKKVGSLDEKVNQQRVTVNGNSGLQSAISCTVDSNSHYAVGLAMESARVMQGNNIPSCKIEKDDQHPSESHPNNLMTTSGVACVTPADLSVVRISEEKLLTESKLQPSANSETVIKVFDHPQALRDPYNNDQIGMRINSDHPLINCYDTNLKVKDLEKSCCEEILERNSNKEITEATIGLRENGMSSSDAMSDVGWIGDIFQVVDEKTYYKSCCVKGVVYKVQDHALFCSNYHKLMPSKLQCMWEDSKTRSKWVVASRCYFPADLPEAVGCPCGPEINEVYDSNHDSFVMAGLIEGPCKVLPTSKFIEESGRRSCLETEESEGLQPLFVCKWFFDEPKGLFRAVTS